MTPKERAAMRQAIEFIVDCEYGKAELALRKALAEQAEQEPVWYARKDQLQKCVRSTGLCEISPEPRQDRIPLYIAPVRTKDLTDEEIASIGSELAAKNCVSDIAFARTVIAADRGKNK